MALNPPIGGTPPLSFEDRWGPTPSSFKDRWGAMNPPQQPQVPHQNPMIAALQGAADPTMQAMFAHPAQHLQRMAGDVVPLPIKPGPNAGPDPQALYKADMLGVRDPNTNVTTMPSQILHQHMLRHPLTPY